MSHANPREIGTVVALRPLQVVAGSLREVESGRVPDAAFRRRTVRSLRAGGPTCVPLLLRALRSTDERLANWSYFLLARLGGGRVVRELQGLLRDEDTPDQVKGMALALLAELHAPPPPEITLRDPDVVIARSVQDLLGGLKSADDVAQAADLVVAQVDDQELGFFCNELVRHGGPNAHKLVKAIAAGEVSDGTREELAELLKRPAPIDTKATPRPRRMKGLLERALAHLEHGRLREALPDLRRFVRANPEDVEGHSSLGVCLLELDQPVAALPHLDLAFRAEPDEILHHWNMAAAAQKARRIGRCYLALKAYLAGNDPAPGADERRDEAAAFVQEYEEGVTADHPNVDPERLARGEEVFLGAFEALSAGRAREAAEGFEKVLRLVPLHYPAWGHLGMAFAKLGEHTQARECLRRALEIKPDYETARVALRELDL